MLINFTNFRSYYYKVKRVNIKGVSILVIDGHLDRPGGYPAIFWRLRDMKVDEDVQVTNTAGKKLHFRVTRVAYYAPGQAPLQDIFGNQEGAFLNLITCAGDRIPSQHQTALRLVVYTSLV